MLARAGEDGADALIEQIAAISGQNERRVYFDALLQLQAGVPTLIHMLGDARWFVARNAAELLGEMQASEAEPQLTELLRHSDDRVRRAATSALMRLGTSRAMQAIQDALKDGAPAMRMQAAAALADAQGREDRRDAGARAGGGEGRGGAGRLPPRARQAGDAGRGAAAAEGGRAGARPVQEKDERVSASPRCRGSAKRARQEATDALKGLQTDKDEEVREAATFALVRIARQSAPPIQPKA